MTAALPDAQHVRPDLVEACTGRPGGQPCALVAGHPPPCVPPIAERALAAWRDAIR